MSVIFNTLAEVLHTHIACKHFGKPSLRYICGEDGLEPNYPVPAIDYYNSANPQHIPIGNMMEWSIPVDVQLYFRKS